MIGVWLASPLGSKTITSPGSPNVSWSVPAPRSAGTTPVSSTAPHPRTGRRRPERPCPRRSRWAPCSDSRWRPAAARFRSRRTTGRRGSRRSRPPSPRREPAERYRRRRSVPAGSTLGRFGSFGVSRRRAVTGSSLPSDPLRVGSSSSAVALVGGSFGARTVHYHCFATQLFNVPSPPRPKIGPEPASTNASRRP